MNASVFFACRKRGLFFVVFCLLLLEPASGLAQIAYQRLMSLGAASVTGYQPYAPLVEGPDGVLYSTAYWSDTVYRINKDASGFRSIGSVRSPYDEVVLGPDGALYGTSQFNTIFKLSRDGSDFRVLLQLPAVANGGGAPSAYLLLGDDGFFYSTTRLGGVGNNGVIFKVKPDGSGYTELHRFLGSISNDGADARSGLAWGSDGALYGVTFSGGTNNLGVVFKINRDGGDYVLLHHFQGAGFSDGSNPHARLLLGSDGLLYGTTQNGGMPLSGLIAATGTIFKIAPDGSGYTVIHRFDPARGRGASPYAFLIEGTNGALYGTTIASSNAPGPFAGTLFRINRDGSDFVVLHQFGSAPGDGQNPHSGLLKASDGAFYGTTWFGGAYNQGTIYRIDQDGSGYKVLASFLPPTRPTQNPRAPVLQGSDGLLYGATEGVGSTNFGSAFALDRNGEGWRSLHDFGVVTNDGRVPNGLFEASDGLLYGTTQAGGTNRNGTVFKISKNGGGYTVLRSFLNSADGGSSRARVLEGSGDWFYGCNFVGGSFSRGTVFKLQKDGSGFEVLWHFGAVTNDGAGPQGDLLEGLDGALYGTTRSFGASSRGTVFKLNKDGSGYTNLHHFAGGEDGQNPSAGLLAGRDGALYGTTSGGTGVGTVFALNPDGSGYRVLRSFSTNGTEPRSLRGALIEGQDGMLYGTTFSGGTNNGGTLFAIEKDGTGFRVLWHFNRGAHDGRSPAAGPTLLDDGTLVGDTEAGGDSGFGTIWRLDPREVMLRIVREGAEGLIRWPLTSTSDQLEGTDRLLPSGTSWSPLTAVVATNGASYEARVPLSGPNGLVRLRREWR